MVAAALRTSSGKVRRYPTQLCVITTEQLKCEKFSCIVHYVKYREERPRRTLSASKTNVNATSASNNYSSGVEVRENWEQFYITE